LPSESALLGLGAWSALLDELRGGSVSESTALRAMVLAVPSAQLPDAALFEAGFRECVRELFTGEDSRSPGWRVAHASRRLWLQRGRAERDAGSSDNPPEVWDLARVRRRLERSLVNGGLLLRRARWLRLLADCVLGYREPDMAQARALVIARAEVVERLDLPSLRALFELPARPVATLSERRQCFDAAAYDRLRVLGTELRRVEQEGGELALRIGSHCWPHERVLSLLRSV
jgi:hypothetical protein